jgi:4-aminobutyrate aminotransferase/(S)-3-amino-2-methylpropionate transaminase
MDAVHAGGLGGTYGGNPVACAAALAAIETMRELDLNAAARRIESVLKPALAEIAAGDPGIAEVRGRGAMIAIELVLGNNEPDATRTAQVSKACHEAGLLTLTCGTYGNVLRFLPPLVISDEDLHRGLDILRRALLT